MDGYLTMCARIAVGANTMLGREAGDAADECTLEVLPLATAMYQYHQQQVRMKEICAAVPGGQIFVTTPGCFQ